MKQVLSVLEWIQSVIGFLNFGALTIVVSLQVISRFISQKPLLWSEELARFLLFWLVMNGAALAVMKSRHFTTELFTIEKVKNKTARTVLALIPVLCIFFVGLVMVTYGITFAKVGNYRIMPISQINMMYVYIAIPVSGGLIALYSFFQIVSLIKSPSSQ